MISMTTNLSPNEVLLKAADLIETQGHCTGAYATDWAGTRVSSQSPDAVSFCALGAIRRTCEDFDVRMQCYDLLKKFLDGKNIGEWNDASTLEEVVFGMREAAKGEANV